MRTIGKILKDARVKKKKSIEKISKETKIKEKFVRLIEEENWNLLPEYPVVSGFVRKIAGSLGVSEDQSLAQLRRDYPPVKLSINPKPDISQKFSWSPRNTFFLGVFLVIFAVLGYLGFEYSRFVGKPRLMVDETVDVSETSGNLIKISGTTDTDAIVSVNNQPAVVDSDGNFQAEIEIFEGTLEIEVKAISRSGKETVIIKKVNQN